MKEIKALKTGKWANLDGPHLPTIIMAKGRTYTERQVPMNMMDHLVGKKFAKFVEGTGPVMTSEEKEETLVDNGNKDNASGSGVEQKDIPTVLQEIVESTSGKRQAKDALETWAKANLNGYDLDKSKSLKNCVSILVDVHAEQNGD